MTNEEAIKQLKWVQKRISEITYSPESFEAINLAIEALRQMDSCPVFSDDEVKQPCVESPCNHELVFAKNIVTRDYDLCPKCMKGVSEMQKDDDLCKTCRYGDDCEFSCKIFSGCRTTRCYKYEEADCGYPTAKHSWVYNKIKEADNDG